MTDTDQAVAVEGLGEKFVAGELVQFGAIAVGVIDESRHGSKKWWRVQLDPVRSRRRLAISASDSEAKQWQGDALAGLCEVTEDELERYID